MDLAENVNRFLIRYDKLIDHFISITPEVYEKHHIVPKCLGGLDNDDNIIKLSPKAHFIAHYLLAKAYPDNIKLQHAFAMMIVNNPYQNRKFTGSLYEIAKKARSHALKGVPRPEWVKEKLRKPKPNTENYKKPKSDAQRQNMSKAFKGRVYKKEACIHCGKLCSKTNLIRWHNDKCKLISYAS